MMHADHTRSRLRVAVDIGGTFTDLVLLEGDVLQGAAKTLTTDPDPAEGVASGLQELLEGWDASLISEIVHGTTLVSNALIERKGAVTALIATEGFVDVLTSRRELRYDLYDLFIELPEPLVPRRRRHAVRETRAGEWHRRYADRRVRYRRNRPQVALRRSRSGGSFIPSLVRSSRA